MMAIPFHSSNGLTRSLKRQRCCIINFALVGAEAFEIALQGLGELLEVKVAIPLGDIGPEVAEVGSELGDLCFR